MFKPYEQTKQENEERGYSIVDMNEIKEALEQENREWQRNVEKYVEIILTDDPSLTAEIIVEKATKLATLVKNKKRETEDLKL